MQAARVLGRGALAQLEASRQRIDDLNVYPVPDGDTGTNLTLTVRSVVEALDRSNAESLEALARELSRAALMGARGNSGVIFSQIVRGFADVLGTADPLDAKALARAFRSGSDAAYRAVRRPVEGTMLTVIREMAEEGERPDVRALGKVDAVAAGARTRRGRPAADARAARRPPRGWRRRRRWGRPRRDPPGSHRDGRRRGPARGAGRRGGGAAARRDPPGAVAVPLLHRVRHRGRRPRRGRRRAGARAARRLAPRRRRRHRTQGPRAHRRARAGPRRRHRPRGRRGDRDREHAPPGRRARGAPRR